MKLSFSYTFGPRYDKKVPYGIDNKTLANNSSAKYYLLRAFPEFLKQLSSILTNILRLEPTHVIWFGI